MTYYENKIRRFKKNVLSNQWQIDSVIGTRNYIDNNYDKNLNLELLSKIRLTSKFHLLRLFKRYYGITPKQYLIEKRIEKSKILLKEGSTVTETCYAVGFESTSSFSTLFKKITGLNPSEFQKKQLSISE